MGKRFCAAFLSFPVVEFPLVVARVAFYRKRSWRRLGSGSMDWLQRSRRSNADFSVVVIQVILVLSPVALRFPMTTCSRSQCLNSHAKFYTKNRKNIISKSFVAIAERSKVSTLISKRR